MKVLVTTKHQGVFYGDVPDYQDLLAPHVILRQGIMVISWGTSRGVTELAETGPTDDTFLSAHAPLWGIRDVSSIFTISADAQAVWDTKLAEPPA